MSIKTIGYNEEQFRLNYPEGNEGMWWIQARHQVVMRYLRSDGLDKDTVLDLGCGTGNTVRLLRQAGITCYGCEISPVSVASDIRPYILSPADAREVPPELRQTVKTILALDVLEHIADPRQLLIEVQRLYPNLQRFICTLPAREELWSNYDTYFGHYKRYTLTSARALLQDAGFTVKQAGYFFHLLYLPLWFVVRYRKQRTLHTPPPTWPFFDRILGHAFALEERLLPKNLVGTSVLVVAESPTRSGSVRNDA